ncbi:hypothetical protein [Burkholderia cepacia]|uniref:hypothetical protein n=1 Tax=Burkholderia cepacia TaxID=292 RepID=UPI001C932F4E|nr:hypothetical protein [Burkholderia cepacia]MBY4709004.1 hypothetical protein [Burkholderia cepacia]MBY4738404.1 hypothetical protein [Burkholderia cepacia]MBY4747577.1 hypothetical protein [Burkholderia cepacia]MBY4756644.1 hypothetical protein [Burkholderia cepacia]MBY4772544.1 hypothetical protein [Burkholderia cepacia]
MKKPLLAERDAWAARHGDANLANAGPAVTSSMHGLHGLHGLHGPHGPHGPHGRHDDDRPRALSAAGKGCRP